MPDRLIGRYEEGQAAADLRSLRSEIALLQVRIIELLGQLKDASPENKPIWEMIGNAIMLKAKVLRHESKLRVDKRQMIPVDEMMVLVAALCDVINRHVTDPKIKAAISEDLRQLLDKNSMTS